MEQLVDKIPKLSYHYFGFKRIDQTTKELDIQDVFTPTDLKIVMKSCFLLNDENLALHYYSEYKQLREYGLLEGFFLDLCISHKDWKALQRNFEAMFEHENLPQSIHYSKAMKGLFCLKGYSEIEKLHEQMMENKIKTSYETYSLLLLSAVDQNNQEKVLKLFDEYLTLVKQELADKNSVPKLISFIFQIPMLLKDYDQMFQLLKEYSKKEIETQMELLPTEFLAKLLVFFSKDLQLEKHQALQKMIKESGKLDTNIYIALIQSHTIFGNYRLADKYAYKAHQSSPIPFSNNRIYLHQMKNYAIWDANSTNPQSKKYCQVKLSYLSIMFNKAKYLIFQQYSPQTNVDLLVEIQDYFYRTDNMDNIKALGFIKDINLRRSLNTKANLINLKSDLLQNPELEFRSNKSNKNFFPEFVVNNKELFEKRRIPISAKTSCFILKNYLYLSKLRSSDLHFKKPKEMLIELFQNYGISLNGFTEISINAKFDFFEHYINIFENLELYVNYAGASKNQRVANEAMKYFLNFTKSVQAIYHNKLPFDLTFEVNKELRKISKHNQRTYLNLLNDDCNLYTMLVERYCKSQPKDKKPTLPPKLNKYAHVILEKFFYHLDYEGKVDEQTVLLIFHLLKRGMKLSNDELNEFIGILLKKGTNYLAQILDTIENDMILNNTKYLELYQQKRQCYITCLIYLLNNSGYQYEKIYHKYQILNRYYAISKEELSKINQDAQANTWDKHHAGDFFRSKTGKLFDTKYENYMFKTMNSYGFFNFFNPLKESQFLNTYVSFRNLVLLQIRLKNLFVSNQNDVLDSNPLDSKQPYFKNKQIKDALKKLKIKYPNTLEYFLSSWKIDYYGRMNDYISQVDSFMAVNEYKDSNMIEYSSKKYLKSLIAPTKESHNFFITADSHINSSMEQNRLSYKRAKEVNDREEKKSKYRVKKPNE
ncbi:unnamed protein product [Candida verbasci]|uniref:Uncharacterized protein n=1 Tax=Candida verbasci TaxID=1227364 RepID=A0A9W4TV28_9ASCO|nr:unnamed protein product [Candida verbasci]